MLRDMLAAGQRVRLSVRLDIEEREGLKTENIYATLPGMSDEQIVVVTHTDGFFQGAMDNASGMATGIDIARHYAAHGEGAASPDDGVHGVCRIIITEKLAARWRSRHSTGARSP